MFAFAVVAYLFRANVSVEKKSKKTKKRVRAQKALPPFAVYIDLRLLHIMDAILTLWRLSDKALVLI